MIAESAPWKDGLLDIAETLGQRRLQRRWSDRSIYLLERDVMMAAFAIRKLVEARKVSDEISKRSWPIKRFTRLGSIPDMWNYYEPRLSYDLSSPIAASISTTQFAHQIIHSYIFTPVWEWSTDGLSRGPLDSLQFASDRQRYKYLLSISLDTLINLLITVGDEDVISVSIRRQEDGERYVSDVVGVQRSDPRHWRSRNRDSG